MVYVTVKDNGPLTHNSLEKLSFAGWSPNYRFIVFFGSCLGFFYALALRYGLQRCHPFFLGVFQ